MSSMSRYADPDFTRIDLRSPEAGSAFDAGEWSRRFGEETGRTPEEAFFHTMEQIDVAPLYAESDGRGFPHLAYDMPGLPPFLRGPYPTMYVTRPWTVRQYAGFSTAEESNAFYRRNLAAGHKTLLPQLVEELRKRGREDIIVVIGGVIPAQDYEFLREHGAAAIFGPGTVIPVSAKRVMEELNRRVFG